ncbi:DUF7550 family protein [Halalkalicoccus salilacus]
MAGDTGNAYFNGWDPMGAFKSRARTVRDMSERDDRPLDEEQGRADAPGEEAGTMGNEEPGTQEAAVSAPEKEQPNVKVPAAERTTAPQSPYSMRQVGIGFVVLVVGLLVVFGVPLVLA